MPISAVDTISLAFQHTKRQLVEPFRFGQWVRLAIVGLLAGEMGSSGSFRFPSSFKTPHHPPANEFLGPAFPKIDPALLAALIAVLVVSGIVLFLVMTYVSSVMRFILFDSVLTRECHIRAGWGRAQDQGWKYFLWQLAYTLVFVGVTIILVGIPAALAFAMGWFSPPRAHIPQLVLAGIFVFGLFFIFFVVAVLIQVFTKDFVVPQMALEGVSIFEAWRRLWLMIQLEKGAYAVYAGMKIVLTIGVGIVVGVISFILALLIIVPALGLGIVAAIAGKSGGFTWNVFTITMAVVVGCILLAVLFFLLSLISVPAIVFFPAYAIYFFAARYPALSIVLYPPRSELPGGEPGTPPPEPPPLMPAPAPVG